MKTIFSVFLFLITFLAPYSSQAAAVPTQSKQEQQQVIRKTKPALQQSKPGKPQNTSGIGLFLFFACLLMLGLLTGLVLSIVYLLPFALILLFIILSVALGLLMTLAIGLDNMSMC